jgi:hypothetical protein
MQYLVCFSGVSIPNEKIATSETVLTQHLMLSDDSLLQWTPLGLLPYLFPSL